MIEGAELIIDMIDEFKINQVICKWQILLLFFKIHMKNMCQLDLFPITLVISNWIDSIQTRTRPACFAFAMSIRWKSNKSFEFWSYPSKEHDDILDRQITLRYESVIYIQKPRCCVVLQKQQQLGFRELLDASSSSSAATQCWFFHFWIESWQPRWARSERSMRLLSSPLLSSTLKIG